MDTNQGTVFAHVLSSEISKLQLHKEPSRSIESETTNATAIPHIELAHSAIVRNATQAA